ncbi:hypothetical protein SANTM175S_00514 [Streptomyces antimycoticus]
MVNTGQQSVRSEAGRGGEVARVGEVARHEATGGTRGARYEGYEAYEGGSPEAERRRFEKLTRELMRARRTRPGGADSPGAPQLLRPFRAKAALGVENARLRFRDDLPPELCVGYARPGAEYPAVVRLSSASGTERHDTTPDLRRMAVRVQAGPEETHDLLATSFPVSHAADVHEFVAFAKATAGAGSTVEKAFGLFVRLPLAVGWATADGCAAMCGSPPAIRWARWPARPSGAGARSCGVLAVRCGISWSGARRHRRFRTIAS